MKRRHLIYYLEVFDATSGRKLGNLADITTKGCKLVSRQPIGVNEELTLRIELPMDYYADRQLVFAARSLWSANDINPDFYDTGFEVQELGLTERKIIRRLIERVGFND